LLFLVLQDGLTRQQLDVAELVAEAEAIAGLPPHPAALPLSQSDAELTSFGLRRVESTASSHALLRAELAARLALLQVCRQLTSTAVVASVARCMMVCVSIAASVPYSVQQLCTILRVARP
jgi:hypothetical protein